MQLSRPHVMWVKMMLQKEIKVDIWWGGRFLPLPSVPLQVPASRRHRRQLRASRRHGLRQLSYLPVCTNPLLRFPSFIFFSSLPVVWRKTGANRRPRASLSLRVHADQMAMAGDVVAPSPKYSAPVPHRAPPRCHKPRRYHPQCLDLHSKQGLLKFIVCALPTRDRVLAARIHRQ